MLKNRKMVGSLPEQNIRSQSKPLIMDMETYAIKEYINTILFQQVPSPSRTQ